MNVLFWMFLGGAAMVAFPLIFHLIRRTPRGTQTFSSLMFLSPTPPKLTRRSRLDDLLLLLLRAMVILLLVAAYMRPYWRTAADISLDGVRGRRIAILLDTSASMRRGDLWTQAIGQVDALLDDVQQGDDVALYTFDRDLQPVVAFDKQQIADGPPKPSLIHSKLPELGPSWKATDLGKALVTVAEALDEIGDEDAAGETLQIVVISDAQRGSRLNALESLEWPPQVHVDLQSVSLPDNSNAHLQLLVASDAEGDSDDPRVRVINALDSTTEEFTVRWQTAATREREEVIAFYVPPGQSRVLSVPRTKATLSADRLALHGDQAVFDDTYYVVPLRQQQFRLAYIGSDTSADGPRHYLEAAFAETELRRVDIVSHAPGDTLPLLPSELPHVVVVAEAVNEEQRDAIDQYLSAGGTALVLLTSEEIAASLGELMTHVQFAEASSNNDDYRMLGEIDFSHPLFTPFATPRYNDFTGIRFWRHQPVSLQDDPAVHVVARFDNNQPALWEQQVGKGKLFVLTSGWQPSDSQLAQSTKFVPLLEGILQQSTRGELEATSYRIGESVPLPDEGANGKRFMRTPDGDTVTIAAGATSFDDLDQPGIYVLTAEGEEHRLAVNLASSESDTAPLEIEQLEQRGVKLGTQASREEEFERLRQLRDTELESRQKLWKWFVLAALVFVGLEMCLSGWRARKSAQAAGEAV